MMFDMILKDCTVIDEQGGKQRTDIGFKAGKIKAVGFLSHQENNCEAIDINGGLIFPGFIDAHSHSDEACFNDRFLAKIAQGITTEVCGNCGGSAAPLSTEASYEKRKMIKKDEDTWYTERRWTSFQEYFKLISDVGIPCNQMTFAGWWTIYDDAAINANNVDHMFKMVEECLEYGCLGISINQGSRSWQQLDISEKLRLFEALAKHHKMFTVHLSSYSDFFTAAIDEIYGLVCKYPVKVIFSHMKFLGEKRERNLAYFYEILHSLSDKTEVKFDIYPYVSICTRLGNLINQNGFKLNDFVKLRVLKSNTVYASKEGIWQEKDIGRLRELYTNEGNLLIEADGMQVHDVEKLISSPECFIGTDYSSCELGPKSRKINHERAFDTFSAAINLLLRLGHTAGEIISKTSYNPAMFFNAKYRGAVREGYYADLIVAENGDELKDMKIKAVFVNGKMSYQAGEILNTKSGTALTG
jgi:N-acyl-D-aspartate/D-glutamate deacylase